MSVVLDHGVVCFYEMVASERKEFFSRGEKRFHSSIFRFEIRTGKVKGESWHDVDRRGRTEIYQ